jgi:hypothetical protein
VASAATCIAREIGLVGTPVLIWLCIPTTTRQAFAIPGATLHVWVGGGTGAGIAATTVIARVLEASTVVPIPIKAIIPVSVRAIISASIHVCCAWGALYRDVEAMCLKPTNTMVCLWDDGPRPGLCVVV